MNFFVVLGIKKAERCKGITSGIYLLLFQYPQKELQLFKKTKNSQMLKTNRYKGRSLENPSPESERIVHYYFFQDMGWQKKPTKAANLCVHL